MIVRFFGKLSDQLGRSIDIALPGNAATVSDLRTLLKGRYPGSADDLDAHAARACIGDEMVAESRPVHDADAVEFLPPLSGG